MITPKGGKIIAGSVILGVILATCTLIFNGG